MEINTSPQSPSSGVAMSRSLFAHCFKVETALFQFLNPARSLHPETIRLRTAATTLNTPGAERRFPCKRPRGDAQTGATAGSQPKGKDEHFPYRNG